MARRIFEAVTTCLLRQKVSLENESVVHFVKIAPSGSI